MARVLVVGDEVRIVDFISRAQEFLLLRHLMRRQGKAVPIARAGSGIAPRQTRTGSQNA